MQPDQSPLNCLNEKTVRRVLGDWASLKALGNHSLANLAIVKARHQVAGYTQSAAGRGLALREVLQTALETLKPDDSSPAPEVKEWRAYLILTEQFGHGRSPEWVTEQLHVSKGTYYGEQKRALARLADKLQQWEEELSCLRQPEPTSPVPLQPLSWLRPARLIP